MMMMMMTCNDLMCT